MTPPFRRVLVANRGEIACRVMATLRRLGIESELPEVCSITLGSVQINALEMTNAYATLAEESAFGMAEYSPAMAGTALQKYNVVITDPAGRVLAKVWDLSARPLLKPDSESSRRLQYFCYDWLESPLAAPLHAEGAHATVLVIAKDPKLALELAGHPWAGVESGPGIESGPGGESESEINSRPEVKVVLAQAGESCRAVDALSLQFDAASEAGYRELIATLRDRTLLPDRVVYCPDKADAPSVHAIRSLFLALESVSPGRAVRCAVLAQADMESAQPHDQAVSALAKSLLTINHRFELFTVLWDAADPQQLALAIGNERLMQDYAIDVAPLRPAADRLAGPWPGPTPPYC